MVLFILISCISSHREVNRFNARTHSEEVTGKDMYLNYQLTYCHKMWTRQHLFLNIFVPRDIIIPWFFYRGLAVISTVCILNGEMGWGGWGLEQICWQVNRKKSMFKFADNSIVVRYYNRRFCSLPTRLEKYDICHFTFFNRDVNLPIRILI